MRVSDLTRDEFIARFGGVYEHSPHLAERVWDTAQRTSFGDPQKLVALFRAAVSEAGYEAQIALVRAHPDLANRVAMSPESTSEQKGAGLDQCSPEEFREFQELNAAYKTKFGFSFIIAVRGHTRESILAVFRERLNNEERTEFTTALEQIHKIAGFRIRDIFNES